MTNREIGAFFTAVPLPCRNERASITPSALGLGSLALGSSVSPCELLLTEHATVVMSRGRSLFASSLYHVRIPGKSRIERKSASTSICPGLFKMSCSG